MTKGKKVWPIVLILDRDLDPVRMMKAMTETPGVTSLKSEFPWENWFHWVDSCGSRSIWYWAPEDEYEKAQDLPLDVFEVLEQFVTVWRQSGHKCTICLRREDPGLGIYIPELDDAVRAAGELPDGVIALKNGEKND